MSGVLAILQARMGSARLPGKVMAPILGAPMIERQVERLRRARACAALVVATTTEPSDDALAAWCDERGLACFRGSRDDVLDRFHAAAAPRAPTHVVRLTADCPLADWRLIDRLVDACLAEGWDFGSTALHPTWPDGLDAEIVTWPALERAWREARLRSEREHVTPWIYGHPELFRLGEIRGERDLSQLRWTVDTQDDLEFVRAVYESLYPGDRAFVTEDVLRLLATRPDLAARRSAQARNEGHRRSLAADQPPTAPAGRP